MGWVTINGAHVLIGEDDGSGPGKTEQAVQKARQAKLVTCRECGRKVVPKGRDVCDRKECRDSFARGLRQWHRMYGIGKKDLPAVLGVKKYLGNPKHLYKST
jgi:hypothetical protein